MTPHAGAAAGRKDHCRCTERGARGRVGRTSPTATFMNRRMGCASSGLWRRRGGREWEERRRQLGLWVSPESPLESDAGASPMSTAAVQTQHLIYLQQ
jgi:hypothetical protein